MKKLAIRFGDNDFYNTFIPVLKTISRTIKDGGKEYPDDNNLYLTAHY